MSKLSFTFPVNATTAHTAVLVTAELQGCRVVEETPATITLRKGTLLGSLAFGFASLYLRFRVELHSPTVESTLIHVHWIWNWWQGLPGYFRTRKAIRQFTESLRDGLQAWQADQQAKSVADAPGS